MNPFSGHTHPEDGLTPAVSARLGELVPKWIDSWASRGGPTGQQIEAARSAVPKLLRRVEWDDRTAVKPLADALAALAFQPGGVTFFDGFWEVCQAEGELCHTW